MNLENIISVLKNYYPFGVSVLSEEYESSEEYLKRMQILHVDRKIELERMKSFKKILKKMLNSNIESYSFVTGHLCHHYTFHIQSEPFKYYSLLISHIIPYYTIRTLNIRSWEEDFSSFQFNYPDIYDILNALVIRFFPNYRIINNNEILNTAIEGVEIDQIDSPTLLDLAFTNIKA